ncbi:SDR family oxidoreductase [Acidobacteria bacterium AB60]|nr:SDR family oxidoreductase [Acidobacteria bacterium AB60]
MRVFVTGASGFIGTGVVRELVDAGHQVLGLARSDAGAAAVKAAGAEVVRGDLADLDSLRRGASGADAVIHTAFNHDFSKFRENCALDRAAIEAVGETLAGSGGRLIVTSGTAIARGDGRPAMESDEAVVSEDFPRGLSETLALGFAGRGVQVGIMRLPQVHDTRKQGLVTYLIQIARAKGVSAYVGDGSNRWPAAHVSDVVHLYRLALEKTAGQAVYHAVAEEGVPMRQIAEVVGRGLKIPVVSIAPEEAVAHFGFLGMFASWDLAASSAQTRERLGWSPKGPGMIADLEKMEF